MLNEETIKTYKRICRVTGYKSNEHTSMALINTDNSMTDKELIRTVSFKIAESSLLALVYETNLEHFIPCHNHAYYFCLFPSYPVSL